MTAYIIGFILLIITLIIIGLLLRKRIYDQVDRLENWKMEIMSRNIASELSRIKVLNLSGETQEKFESWKGRWDFILTKELPDIEEYLFDAEDAADHYRIPTAKKTLQTINVKLETVEKDLEKILSELEELIHSEETSRKEIAELQPNIKGLRKQISQNRYQYGKADVRFEVELDELDQKLNRYFELTESGNYIEAKHLVDELKENLDETKVHIEEFPGLLKSCKHELPAQLDDLSSGMKTMKEDGYRIEHLGFENEISGYQQRLLDCITALEKGEVETAKETIEEIDHRTAEMYELLEKEAVAKGYIESNMANYERTLDEIASTFQETKVEVETLRKTYYVDDQDTEKYISLEKEINSLRKQLEELKEKLEDSDTAHSELRSMVENGLDQMKEITKNHDAFKDRMLNLRKDEMEAKERVANMQDEINAIHRRLQKSNIPGVPSFIWNAMDEAMDKNNRVLAALDKQPLDMAEVQQALRDGAASIEQLSEQTDMMLDQAYLTEQVIQYANRYRSKFPLLAAKLEESERLFRSYEYELSLEHAAKAIEEVEPGALKRIEEYQLASSEG
ncbi:septation ring formation regulator EzrA [Ornithinibacillus gellani]|uniref:septation ring formation regulator EzrA n=1 Tax=Ornithinibacillus gellani TaxID=2293253 RepID=UPI000F477DBC|nr:septation ring formation regulator EzrA [Ornithinibacillus gellani]TQS76288.1 septation ring formation regulator EzrA [Ornithinibacillus gellani]